MTYTVHTHLPIPSLFQFGKHVIKSNHFLIILFTNIKQGTSNMKEGHHFITIVIHNQRMSFSRWFKYICSRFCMPSMLPAIRRNAISDSEFLDAIFRIIILCISLWQWCCLLSAHLFGISVLMYYRLNGVTKQDSHL